MFRVAVFGTERVLVAGCLGLALAAAAPLAVGGQREVLEGLCGDSSQAQRISAELDSIAAQALPADIALPQLRATAFRFQRDAKYAEARALFGQALRDGLQAPARNDQVIADDMEALAQLRRWSSRYIEADALLRCVLNIRLARPEGQSHPTTGTALGQLAQYHLAFGQIDIANDLARRAVALLEPAADPWAGHLGTALTVLANVLGYAPQTEPVRARRMVLYQAALEANGRLPECKSACMPVAISKDNLANLLADSGAGHLSDALRLANEALGEKLELIDPGNDSVATSLLTLAHIAALQGRRQDAKRVYRQATGILQLAAQALPSDDIAILSRVAEATGAFGAFCEHLGTPEDKAEAIVQYTISVNARQRMRAGADGLPDEYRNALSREVAAPYYQLSGLLIRAGRLVEAERVVELLKNEELAGLFRGGQEQSPRPPEQVPGTDAHFALARQWIASARELTSLERRNASTLTPAERTHLTELRTANQALIDAYQTLLATIAKQSEPKADLADARVTELGKKVKLDPAGAVALHYVVMAGEIGIIVVLPDMTIARSSTVSYEALREQIGAFRQAVRSQVEQREPRLDPSEASRALWRMLIDPVLPILQARAPETLVLSLTDVLRYLPFAALQDKDGHHLVEYAALVNWAGAADIAPVGAKPSWKVAAMGLTKGRLGLTDLPDVEGELEAIVKKPGVVSKGVIGGASWLDNDFTRQRFDDSLRGTANIIHVASHFTFVPGDEKASILLLGKPDETLSLYEVRAMNFDRIELLTLSACDTAVGEGKNQNGVEVEGLSATVLRRGGKSVVATLWKVPSPSTADFMTEFYKQLSLQRTRAQSMRTAQLKMLGARARKFGEGKGTPGNLMPAWPNPIYWAPFVLTGNWL